MLPYDAFTSGLFLGGMLWGGVCGMLPLVTALRLRRVVIGCISFVLCVGAGFLGGLLFGVPTAFVLTWLVSLLGSRPMIPLKLPYEGPSRRRGERLPEEPYTQIGPTIVCNQCGTASSAGAGGRPLVRCPGCELPFRDEDPSDARRARQDDDVIDLKVARRG